MEVPRMELAPWWAILGCLFLAAGCRGGEPPPFTRIAPDPVVVSPPRAGASSFDDYATASQAILAAEGIGKLGNRATLYEAQRHKVQKAVMALVPQLERAASRPCDFREPAIIPFDRGKYHEGWRLIGLGLQWEILEACERQEYDHAIRLVVLATKMGMDLCGGSALDASQGIGIANAARAAISPDLEKMSVGQLDRLESGLRRAVERMPAFDITMANELNAMLIGVQWVQDSYEKRQFDDLEVKLGPGVRDAVDYLREMRVKERLRVAYFAGFADEARKEASEVVAWSKLPVSRRPTSEELSKADQEIKFRPWRRLAPHFLRGARSLLPVRDAFLARTRLLVQECHLIKLRKAGTQLPESLPLADPSLSTDPYSGAPLKYQRLGSEYKLYSLGPDLKDDDGEINTDFTSPDLGIERSR